MRLCSHHLFNMTEIVSRVFSTVLFAPIGANVRIGLVDTNTITLIALYMANDREAHETMQAELGKRNPAVLEAWLNIFDYTVLRNNELAENETIDVNTLLRRIADENQRGGT